MEVETGLASLLDKLKVEDPWLPPRTWESLPSESGRPMSRVPASSDCSYASSVSERSIVRLALNALLGLESAIVSIEKLSSAFCAESADRTFHNIPSLWNRMSSTDALGRILRSIGCFGSLVFLLHKFVDHFSKLSLSEKTMRNGEENSGPKQSENISYCNVEGESCSSYSLVNQAFAIAVRKVLEGYICALDTLCASVEFRRSPNNVGRPMNDSLWYGCLANVVQPDLTLLEVYLHTRELRTQIEALGNICNLHDVAASYVDSSLGDLTVKANLLYQNFYRGGDLLTYLYTQLKVADPAHHPLLKFLFLRSCEPYFGFIRSWIFKAQISDPYDEFILERADFPSHWQSKPDDSPMPRVMERERAVIPCFLKSFLVPLVRAGQQLQVVMKLLELCTYSASENDSYADLLPCWTGYSGAGPFVASLMTFSKMHIERMAQERDFYYEKMQSKLVDISRKLELSSDELSKVRCLISSISITLEDSMSVPSTAEDNSAAADRALDSDDQNKEDGWSSEVDESSSSECSSTEASEEQTEGEQLKLPNKFVGPIQTHFSALSFSMISLADNSFQKQLQLDKSCHMELNSHCKSMRKDSHDLFIKSQLGDLNRPDKSFHCKVVREDDHDLLVKSQLEESNRVCKDVNNYENLSVKLWPLGGLSRSPFCADGDSVCEVRLCLSDSGRRRRKTDVLFNDYTPLFNRTPISDSGTTKRSDGSQLEYMSMLDKKKVNQPGSLLSINPMLMRSVFFTPDNKLAEGNVEDRGKLLPWFDLSLVDDPCKAFSGKLSAGFTDDIPEKPTDSVTTSNSHSQSKKGYCASNIVVEESRSYSYLPWGSMNRNGENPTYASGGGGWESLLGRLNMLDCGEAGGCVEDSFDACELPLDVVIDKCLLQEILLQYNYVSKLTITVLEEGFSLKEHLLALRRYHFMELADWADIFIKSLWHHKWLVPETDQRTIEIQRFLKLSIQRSSCEQDLYKDRLFVYVKGQDTVPRSSSAIGIHAFDFLGLGYRVNWPVSIILTSDALKAYADIFSFLIRMKLAALSLTDMWCSMKDVMPLINQNRHDVSELEVRRLKVLLKLRHQVNHFVSTLQQYVQSELAHVSWSKFFHSLKHKVKDMMDLESLHMAYLNESLHICFLSDETRAISRIISNILQCVLDFRSCLHRGTRDSEPYQGDVLTKSLGVNTTQAVAVKQEFEKHMKELQRWYMRSPNKHGELGLSRFWGYLNFNEYYSDLFNDATGSAFLF